MIEKQKKAEKIYLAKELKNKIHELVPKFETRLQFMALLEPDFNEMKIPDLKYLNKLYWIIGGYLHYFNQKFDKNDILNNLTSALDYIDSLEETNRCFIEFNQEGERLFERYEQNNLSKEELIDIKKNAKKYHNGGLYS